MRRFGFILIAAGLALLVYFVLLLFQNDQTFHSPIPEEKGVKVIYITPSK
ncbi:MAG TPA: hypothetical protein VK338_05395 [Candidatus Nitrosocosmicus sp.]|nr:hypothetical protein [Candidatus Nitrosocosmicus sp.]